MRAVFITLFAVSQLALAEPGEREAMALAVKGARYLQEHGKDALIASINRKDPAFNQGALYLAVRDLNGITIVFASRRNIINHQGFESIGPTGSFF